MARQHNRPSETSIGTRYCRRDNPNIVWEVISVYTGVDGRPHAVLSSVSDPLWRKTLSQFELEHGGQYRRLSAE